MGVFPPPPPQAAIKMDQATNTVMLHIDFMLYYLSYRQFRALGSRGVIHSFSEEARTRGFPPRLLADLALSLLSLKRSSD